MHTGFSASTAAWNHDKFLVARTALAAEEGDLDLIKMLWMNHVCLPRIFRCRLRSICCVCFVLFLNLNPIMKEELSWCKVNYIYIYITFEKALEYLEYQIVARDGCVIIFEKKLVRWCALTHCDPIIFMSKRDFCSQNFTGNVESVCVCVQNPKKKMRIHFQVKQMLGFLSGRHKIATQI